jgi:tetratricopeptide (TPR) repeat protein
MMEASRKCQPAAAARRYNRPKKPYRCIGAYMQTEWFASGYSDRDRSARQVPAANIGRAVMRRYPSVGVAVLALSVVMALGGRQAAAAGTMFDEGRAQKAFAAIESKVGHKLRLLDLTIRPDDLTVAIPDPDKPGNAESWQVSQKGLMGTLGGDTPTRLGSSRAQIISGTLEENLTDMDADSLAVVPKLAAETVSRARLQTPAKITEIELRRLPKIVEPGVRDPTWLAHIEGVGEEADISFKLDGTFYVADLNHTLRAENLNLFAGGADLNQMVDDIRSQIKDKWIFHYVEIDKQAINFDVTLASIGDRARMTRFTASLDKVQTTAMSTPHSGYMNLPADPPFDFKDIDWSLLTKIEEAAKDRLQIADGVVQSVVITKPESLTGGGIEWEVRVRSAKAPIFFNPSQPPIEEGSVGFDMTGNILHTKYPPGRGPQVNLFDAAALQKAVDTIQQRLGAHLPVTELLINADSIEITAQDPKDPKKFVIFTYKDEAVTHGSDMRAQMLLSFGAGPGWLWELGSLQPPTLQPLARLEQQTMARWGIANGHVSRITISKDKMFHASNDRPLIEIRVAGEDDKDQWLYFDFAGNVADPDRPAGGGSASAGSAPANLSRDEQDCTGSDPARIIAGCTRMTQNQREGAHNRAVAFYNRGGVYKDRGDYDRAIADFDEALGLDPKYANAYLNRGFAYASKGDNDNALPDFDRAVELKPQEPLGYFDRSFVRSAKKDYDGAIADLSKTLDLGMKEQIVYANRALNYQYKGDNRHALADYDETLKMKPNDAVALTNRGMVQARLKDDDHALADFTAAIKVDPSYAGAYRNRGDLYRAQGKFDSALADYDRLLKLDPKNAGARLGRGYVFRAKGDPDQSIAEFTEALKLDPGAPATYLVRGLVILGKGDADGAIADFSAALKADAKSASAYQYRGVAYYLAGSLPKALADLTQANALAPADAYTAMLLDIVAQGNKLQSNLAQTSAKLDMTAWPAPVVRLLLGQMTMDALSAAGDDPDPAVKRKHLCEGSFYPAELALLHGDRDGATKLLSVAAAECPLTFEESVWAAADLRRAGVTPPAGKP